MNLLEKIELMKTLENEVFLSLESCVFAFAVHDRNKDGIIEVSGWRRGDKLEEVKTAKFSLVGDVVFIVSDSGSYSEYEVVNMLVFLQSRFFGGFDDE